MQAGWQVARHFSHHPIPDSMLHRNKEQTSKTDQSTVENGHKRNQERPTTRTKTHHEEGSGRNAIGFLI